LTDYSSWAEKAVQVTNLLLDAENPRIPSGGATLGQRDLIAELVEHDKVYELAKNIAEAGYFPLESMIGLTEDGKTYILEGNRRLAALKLLVSPDLAPQPDIKKFRNLSGKVPLDSIKKVRVLFAPSREAAAPLIMQKHTRDQVQRWSPLMQARFFRTLAAGGLTAEELAENYDTAPGEVAEFLRMDTMYEVACAMELPQQVRDVVHNPRKFNASALQRLIAIPKARDFLGISFDERGALRGSVHADEFRKGFKRIISDIALEKIDTRTLNKVSDAEKYLQSLEADAPDTSRRGSFTDQDLKKGKTPAEEARPAIPKPGKVTGRRISSTLIPTGMKCRIANPKVREVFDELRQLKVDRFPNSCAAMLRILLELSMGHYLEKSGNIEPLLERARKKGKPNNWYPSWKEMLAAMLQIDSVDVKPPARRRLNKLISDKDYSFLDGVMHNKFVTSNTRELRDITAALESIFEVVLQEPMLVTKPAPKAAK